MKEGWRGEVAILIFQNRHSEALVLLHQAMDEGLVAARVMLAQMGEDAGLSRAESNKILEDVETNLDPADADTHLALVTAYEMGLGNLSYDEKARRRFRYLLRAVEIGADPSYTLDLARIYALGALEVKPDPDQAIRWYIRAIEQGQAGAAQELQKFYRHLDRLGKNPRN